jgi:hypothetical protein
VLGTNHETAIIFLRSINWPFFFFFNLEAVCLLYLSTYNTSIFFFFFLLGARWLFFCLGRPGFYFYTLFFLAFFFFLQPRGSLFTVSFNITQVNVFLL